MDPWWKKGGKRRKEKNNLVCGVRLSDAAFSFIFSAPPHTPHQ
jgi:hypothetical protein